MLLAALSRSAGDGYFTTLRMWARKSPKIMPPPTRCREGNNFMMVRPKCRFAVLHLDNR